MTTRELLFKDFSIVVADGWADISETLDSPESLLTLANPDSGVGALQLAPAIYKAGSIPRVTPTDLEAMLFEFGKTRQLGTCFDQRTYPDDNSVVGASYHSSDDFIRVWYVSDATNVMLITYVCDWNSRDIEAVERETTVRSVRFIAKDKHLDGDGL